MAILVAVFSSVFLLGLGVSLYARRRAEASRREQKAGERLIARQSLVADGSASQRRETPRVAPADANEFARALNLMVLQAGASFTPMVLLGATIVLFICGFALSLIRLPVVPALGCGAALASVPYLYLRMKRHRRLRIMSKQLPYVLEMLGSALQAGHTLRRGLQMAAENTADPLARELRMIVDHVRVGMRLPLAFDLMYRRVPVEELSFLAAAVRVQEETGSSLGEILERVTQSIRSRQRLHDQIQTLTSQARLSALIVSALPFAILAAFYLLRPDYVSVLFTDPLGIRLLQGAIALDAVAFVVMRRIAQVDF